MHNTQTNLTELHIETSEGGQIGTNSGRGKEEEQRQMPWTQPVAGSQS